MSKKEEIAEMSKFIEDRHILSSWTIACELYDKGYRKKETAEEIMVLTAQVEVLQSEKENLERTLKETGEVLRDIEKETAEEILKMLVGHTLVDDGWTWTISADDVWFIAEKYGTEVNE